MYLNEDIHITKDNINILNIVNNICHKNDTYAYTFYESCDSFMESGLYIYAFGEKHNIGKLYFDLNKYIKSNQATTPTLLFPIQSSIITGYRFGSEHMFKYLRIYFAELHICFMNLRTKHVDSNIIFLKTIYCFLRNLEIINNMSVLYNTLRYLTSLRINNDSLISTDQTQNMTYAIDKENEQIYSKNKNNIAEILSDSSPLSNVESILKKIHFLFKKEYSHASSPYNEYNQLIILRNIILHIGGILFIHSYYKQVILSLLYLHLKKTMTNDF